MLIFFGGDTKLNQNLVESDWKVPAPKTSASPMGSPAVPVPTTEVLDAHVSILRRRDTTQLEADGSQQVQQVPLFQ